MPRGSSHSWEQPVHDWDVEPEPRVPHDADGWGGDYSGSDAEEDETTPAVEFIHFMVSLLLARTLNARQFCVAMHWAGRAGLECAKPYGFAPGKSSGHYARHLKPLLGSSEQVSRLYEVDIPGHHKLDLSRTVHHTPTLPPHEAVAEAMTPEYIQEAKEAMASDHMPPAYEEHPVVQAARAADPFAFVFAFALFIDAVPYSICDSVLGVWIECVLTGRRWLCAILRKRNSCQCGCRGWCSFYPLFRMLHWSLGALAESVWPTARHDNRPWLPSDNWRRDKAGERMPHPGAVVYVKGDWCEYSGTCGMPNWNDGLRPCFSCAGSGADLFVSHGNNILELRWPSTTAANYEAACVRCERLVTLTDETKALVLQYLRYDKRDSGSHGRALTQNIPSLGLLANDRLEPSPALPNVAGLEELQMPATVTFWRPSEESICRHRNPLFCARIGLSVVSLTVDTLHALYLGVMNRWCAIVIWFLFSSGVFGANGAADENLRNSILLLRNTLTTWYGDDRRANPSRVLTRLNDLTVKMVGTSAEPKCKTKGAETFGMLLFLVDMLGRYATSLDAASRRLHRAGCALVRLVEIWDSCGRVMPPAARQELKLKIPNKFRLHLQPRHRGRRVKQRSGTTNETQGTQRNDPQQCCEPNLKPHLRKNNPLHRNASRCT